jgi:hypothetical protein
VLFRFLENYLNQLEGPLAVQVWHRFLQLAKDVISNIRDFRPQVFPVLRFVVGHLSLYIISLFLRRCISILADKITQTTALEDRRIRKDLQVFFFFLVLCLWRQADYFGLGYIRKTSRCYSSIRQSEYRYELLDPTKQQRRPGVKRSGFPNAPRYVL